MNKHATIIKNYFSDYATYLLSISFLFIITLTASIIFNPANKFIWIIPIVFIIIYLTTIKLFVLYCKVRKDIKENNIETLTVKISEFKDDNNYNFITRGGTTVGKNKYKIIDENNNFYLLSEANKKSNKKLIFMDFRSNPNFYLEIEFLKKSRLVLSMKLAEDIRTNKEQQHNMYYFKKLFSHYF